MKELQINTKKNIEMTLEYLSSSEKQIDYKTSVSFVHIPKELAEQWENHKRLRNRRWYQEIWAESQIIALDDFDEKFNQNFDKLGKQIPDVPEILEKKNWKIIMESARICLQRIK